ncbi:S-adenosylmethionine sensor upstream of mTORC1 [Ixodes scapularis]
MSREQQQLVSVIRGVHEKLRFDYQSTGDEERVWESHCRDAELRKRYADSMLRLATTIWPFRDRIEWCHQTLRSYFYEGGLKRALRSLPSFDQNAESAMEHALRLLQLPPGGKVRLLDVGSCYDPFRCYEDIEAVAVDLTPAREGVLECDFLKLRVTDPSGGRWSPYVLTNPLVELPAASFQAVVMCMVLEYLPSCLQRWTFCRKAAALLRPYGLLLVVTPDSKHQQRNAAMVASWKEALGNLGLPKLRYEKRQHLHCMAFYRCGPTRELSENEEAAEARKMYIPQDSRDYVALFSKVAVEERDEAGDVALGEGFLELPDCVDL